MAGMLKIEIDRSLNNCEAVCNKLEQPHYGNCQLRFRSVMYSV